MYTKNVNKNATEKVIIKCLPSLPQKKSFKKKFLEGMNLMKKQLRIKFKYFLIREERDNPDRSGLD